jgi:hypothetical protein
VRWMRWDWRGFVAHAPDYQSGAVAIPGPSEQLPSTTL